MLAVGATAAVMPAAGMLALHPLPPTKDPMKGALGVVTELACDGLKDRMTGTGLGSKVNPAPDIEELMDAVAIEAGAPPIDAVMDAVGWNTSAGPRGLVHGACCKGVCVGEPGQAGNAEGTTSLLLTRGAEAMELVGDSTAGDGATLETPAASADERREDTRTAAEPATALVLDTAAPVAFEPPIVPDVRSFCMATSVFALCEASPSW